MPETCDLSDFVMTLRMLPRLPTSFICFISAWSASGAIGYNYLQLVIPNHTRVAETIGSTTKSAVTGFNGDYCSLLAVGLLIGFAYFNMSQLVPSFK